MSLKMMRVVPRGGGDWCVTSERKVHLQGVSALAIARMVSVGVDGGISGALYGGVGCGM